MVGHYDRPWIDLWSSRDRPWSGASAAGIDRGSTLAPCGSIVGRSPVVQDRSLHRADRSWIDPRSISIERDRSLHRADRCPVERDRSLHRADRPCIDRIDPCTVRIHRGSIPGRSRSSGISPCTVRIDPRSHVIGPGRGPRPCGSVGIDRGRGPRSCGSVHAPPGLIVVDPGRGPRPCGSSGTDRGRGPRSCGSIPAPPGSIMDRSRS